jgi:hypothetical protein
VIEAPSQYAVDMLDECEVALVQRVFLCLVTVIKSHLFTVVYQPRMLKSEFALQSRFIGDVLAKWRCKSSHDRRRYLNNQTHEEETFATNAPG